MDLFYIYLMVILPTLGKVMAGLFGILTVLLFISYLISLIDDCPFKGYIKPKQIVLTALIWTIGLLIPTQDQMKYIIGGYVVTNVEGISELPKNVMGAANKFLEEYTDPAKK